MPRGRGWREGSNGADEQSGLFPEFFLRVKHVPLSFEKERSKENSMSGYIN